MEKTNGNKEDGDGNCGLGRRRRRQTVTKKTETAIVVSDGCSCKGFGRQRTVLNPPQISHLFLSLSPADTLSPAEQGRQMSQKEELFCFSAYLICMSTTYPSSRLLVSPNEQGSLDLIIHIGFDYKDIRKGLKFTSKDISRSMKQVREQGRERVRGSGGT